ncbi:GNAT family N-acetyltransferase [Secundilactobacillus kimchicus]|nr:GNAT family N-acetyltransferase [Secundilactobacillus kimchicus]MBT9672515.1 GNAT family N-acetyltransferase [Secundilactobacillus kimchicus]
MVEVVVGRQKWNRGAALAIRQMVFVTERGIAREAEFDDKDTDETIYAVVYEDTAHPVATARYEAIDHQTVRPGRVATVATARYHGYGAQALLALEAYARQQGLTMAVIHGELDAVPFYERLGYHATGKVFEEDDVPVQELRKNL